MNDRDRTQRPARRFTAAVWLYAIAVHVLMAVLVFKTDFIPKVKSRFFPSPEPSNVQIRSVFAFHERIDPLVPDGAAIFLGDSITQGLATAAVAPLSVNYGIGGAVSEELVIHIPRYGSLKRAGTVFLMVGINDLLHGKAAGLAERLQTLSDLLPPDTAVVWSGVMPTYTGEVEPAQIDEINRAIEAICQRRKLCTFVDTKAVLSPEGESLFTDGIHLNTDGYRKWIAALREAHRRAVGTVPSG